MSPRASREAEGPFALRLEVSGEPVAVYGFGREGPADPRSLTAAELVVAAGIVAGATNAEIARARGTSVRTIANQVASILRKLGVDSRVGLVRRCRFVP